MKRIQIEREQGRPAVLITEGMIKAAEDKGQPTKCAMCGNQCRPGDYVVTAVDVENRKPVFFWACRRGNHFDGEKSNRWAWSS